MSTIKFSIEASGIGGSYVYERIRFSIDYGSGDVILNLENIDAVAPAYKYRSIDDGIPSADYYQAQSYAQSFNRDYKNVGGTGNLSAIVNDDPVAGVVYVIVTAEKGLFSDFSSLGFATLDEIDNDPLVDPLELNASLTGNGDCSTVEYSITASGGTQPYTLRNGINDIQTGWDGSAYTVNINRDTGSVNFNISDSGGLLKNTVEVVPRKLKIGEFKIRSTQYIGYSDFYIENINPVANTEPIEYSLDAQGALTGGSYQASNSFTGVLPGFYEIFVKDKYDCEITKTIEIRSLEDASEEQNPRYFDVPKGNSIIMSECVSFNKEIKPNYNNTLSYNELSDIKYKVVQYYDVEDFEPIHFKSSYPYHVVTLHKCDGTKQDIPPILIQENLGSKEKVDCEIFPLNGQTAVYFDGGNEYEPNTTNVIGASEYTQFLPSWAVEGQIVSIDGIGSYEIVKIGYDSDLDRGYFVVDVITGSSTSGRVQVTWNIQPYNVFEAYVPFFNVDKARVVIEKGFSFDEIDGNPWISEILATKDNEVDDLLFECTNSKNQSDIVFFSGVKFTKRMKGKLRAVFPNSSEIAEGDSRAYSISQDFYQHYRLELERLSAREVHQLLVWSKTDGFKVNGENLIMKQEAEIEALGESNYYSFKCDYAFGGNQSAIQPDSLALNSSTGVIGGGGTGKPGTLPVYDDKLRVNIDGGFLTVDGEFISVDE